MRKTPFFFLIVAMVASCSGAPGDDPGAPESGVLIAPPTLAETPPETPSWPPAVSATAVLPKVQEEATSPEEPLVQDETDPGQIALPDTLPEPTSEPPPEAPGEPEPMSPDSEAGAPDEPEPTPPERPPSPEPETPPEPDQVPDEPADTGPPDPPTCQEMAPNYDDRPYLLGGPVVCSDVECDGGTEHPSMCADFDWVNDSPFQLSGGAYEHQLSVFTDRIPDLSLSEVCVMTVFPEDWEHAGCKIWKVPFGSLGLIQQRWNASPGWAHVVVSFKGSDRACPLSCQ